MAVVNGLHLFVCQCRLVQTGVGKGVCLDILWVTIECSRRRLLVLVLVQESEQVCLAILCQVQCSGTCSEVHWSQVPARKSPHQTAILLLFFPPLVGIS